MSERNESIADVVIENTMLKMENEMLKKIGGQVIDMVFKGTDERLKMEVGSLIMGLKNEKERLRRTV